MPEFMGGFGMGSGQGKNSSEYFDTTKYRKELADELKEENDRGKRKEMLEEMRKDDKFDTAEKVVKFRHGVYAKTKGLFTPEKLDILTSLVADKAENEQRENVMKTTFDELVFEMALTDSEQWQSELDKYLEKSLEKREKLLVNIGKFLEVQDRLPRKLRSHQLNALIKIKDFIEQGCLRGYVAHPTGAGKTVLFTSLIRATEARTLIVVPKKLLVKQTLEELQTSLPDRKLTYISSSKEKDMSDEKDINIEKGSHGDVVVTTDKSFIFDSEDMRQEPFEIIIEDEAHNSYTSKAQHALRHFPNAIKLGFTATPDYYYAEKKPGFMEVSFDDVTLYLDPEKSAARYYPHEIDRISLKEAIEMGMLSDLHAALVRTKINLDEAQVINTKNGLDFNEQSLDKLLEKHWPTLKDQVIKSYFEGVKSIKDGREETLTYDSKQIFAVCTSVKQAEDLAAAFVERGVKAACVTGDTTDSERKEIFKKYRSKEIQILTSVSVLKEGWDAPEAEVCLMLRPTLSRTYYEQVLGRVLRLDPNNPKKKALAVDFLGKYKRMTPMTAAGLFGITEFYNGQLLIPKRKEAANGEELETEKGEESPYNVSTIIQKIEIVEKPTIISDRLLILGKDTYCTMAFLAEHFSIKPDRLQAFLENWAVASTKVGKATYLNAQEVVKSFIENGDIVMYRKGYLSMKDISMELRLNKEYLASMADKYNIARSWEESFNSNKYEVFDSELLWKFVRSDLETKLKNILEADTESIVMPESASVESAQKKREKNHRDESKILSAEKLAATNPNIPMGSLKIFEHVLNQKNATGAKKLLGSINVLKKFSDDEERQALVLLEKIIERKDFLKDSGIAGECRRIRYDIKMNKKA